MLKHLLGIVSPIDTFSRRSCVACFRDDNKDDGDDDDGGHGSHRAFDFENISLSDLEEAYIGLVGRRRSDLTSGTSFPSLLDLCILALSCTTSNEEDDDDG